jgi:hypothetical protein
MNSLWRHLKHELFDPRHDTLILGLISGFSAAIIVHLLRIVFG